MPDAAFPEALDAGSLQGIDQEGHHQVG